MEQESTVTTSVLEIQNLQYAHEQYDDFVDISGPLLNISEFKTRRGLPLNEQCAAVFYGKIAHLKDTEFVELDREMLQMIGFKNTFSKKKNKHGNVKKKLVFLGLSFLIRIKINAICYSPLPLTHPNT